MIMTYSASAVKGMLYYSDQYHFFKMQLLWVALGVAAMVIAMKVDIRLLWKWAKVLFMVSLVLLILVKAPGLGRSVNGANRWIGLGPLSIQPSEVIKLSIVIMVAKVLSQTRDFTAFRRGMLPSLALLGLVLVLVMLQPDLGTSLVIMATVCIMLVAAGARVKHLAMLGGVGLGLVVAAIAAAPYRMQRIFAYIDPWADPAGSGYQTIQSLLALGPGGVFGLGLGQSRQKFLYLPENHTDFIFAMIGEELGFIGGIFVIGVFAFLIWRGFRVAMHVRDPFLSLLAAGFTSLIGVQAMINMGVVTGLLPVTGITLPFLSYGGTSLIFTMAGAGLLLNVSREVS
ncbi:MAG: putative lipid II flippase FtsW [Peptococcaceae bacterium]|nr:putative lipid II flippase FtsW [Peptococcaceae bacterium]